MSNTQRTPQQALKDAIESGAVQAFADGKDIQCGDINKAWGTFSGIPAFFNTGLFWRPAPEPKLRPWKPEEVPVGALYRWAGHVSVILAATHEGICFVTEEGRLSSNFYSVGLMNERSQHSLDNGATWLPCGVMEGGE